eukprot:2316959-Prymnesium_polylepis.1
MSSVSNVQSGAKPAQAMPARTASSHAPSRPSSRSAATFRRCARKQLVSSASAASLSASAFRCRSISACAAARLHSAWHRALVSSHTSRAW